MAEHTPTAEAGKLGPFLAMVLVAGMMIGSGVFLLPATLAAVGSMTLITWLICSAGAMSLAAMFAGLAIIHPSPDGLVDYSRMGLGRYFGFQAGLAYWISMWTGEVALALAAVGYLAHFLPVLAQPWPALFAAIGVIWLVTLIALVGPRFLAKFGALTLALGLAPVLAVALFGWFWFDPATFAAGWNVSGQPPAKALVATIVPVFWAFTGLEASTVAASVVRDPRRNVPIAVLGGVGLTALIYIAACAAIMGIVPAAELARSTAPFALAGNAMFGAIAAGAVALAIVLKILGTTGSMILVTAETTRSSAALSYFPRWLARVRADGNPARALVTMAVVGSLATFLTRSGLNQQFNLMIDVSTVLSTLVYLYCCVTLLRLSGQAATVRGQIAARVCAVVGGLFCLGVILGSGQRLLIGGLAFVAATIPLWALYLLGQKISAARAQAPEAG